MYGKSDPSLLLEHLHVSFINPPPLPAVLAKSLVANNFGLGQAGGYFVNLLRELLFS